MKDVSTTESNYSRHAKADTPEALVAILNVRPKNLIVEVGNVTIRQPQGPGMFGTEILINGVPFSVSRLTLHGDIKDPVWKIEVALYPGVNQ